MRTKIAANRLAFYALIFSLIFSTLPKLKAETPIEGTDGDAVFSNTSPITINTSAPLIAPTVATAFIFRGGDGLNF